MLQIKFTWLWMDSQTESILGKFGAKLLYIRDNSIIFMLHHLNWKIDLSFHVELQILFNYLLNHRPFQWSRVSHLRPSAKLFRVQNDFASYWIDIKVYSKLQWFKHWLALYIIMLIQRSSKLYFNIMKSAIQAYTVWDLNNTWI